jgi:aryl-alcohol dehydrogenase-like predicted oxidoreductase
MNGMTFSRRQALALGTGAAALSLSSLRALAQAAGSVEKRKIPVSGEMLPVIGIGTALIFEFPQDDKASATMAERAAVLQELVKGGGSLVDTAPSYGAAEERIGILIEQLGLRDRIFLATKARVDGAAGTIASFEQSLKLLRTNRVELMQLHNPKDPNQDLEPYREFKKQGRAKYIGFSSSFDRDYGVVEDVLKKQKPDFFQIDYSMVDRNSEERLIPAAMDTGAAVLTNLPFGRGRFFQKVRGKPLPEWATKELGVTSWAQYSLKWALGNPGVTAVIPGTDKAEFMIDNLKAGTGPMPDAAMRKKMVEHFDAL